MSRLQGNRSRWPDILIGLVLLALLGGFVYLLTGQNREPQKTTQTVTTEAPPEIPAAPGTQTATEPVTATQATPLEENAGGNETATTTDGGSAGATPDAREDTAEAAASATEDGSATDSDTGTEEAAATPAVTAPQTPPASPAAGTAPQTAPETAGAASATNTPDPAAPAATPRPGGAVQASENRVPTRSDYRISLGGFADTPTAVRQTAQVAALGYTVYSIDLGDQVVAQVGPFGDAAAAQRALADIQRVYPGAALFAPKAGAKPAAAPSSPTSSRAPSAPALAAPAPATSAPATSAPATRTPAAAAPAPAAKKPAPSQAAPSQAAPAPAKPAPAATAPRPAPAPSKPATPAPKPTPAVAKQPAAPQPAPKPAAKPAATPAPAEPAAAAPKPAPAPKPSPAPKPAPAPAAQAPASSDPVYLQVGSFEEPDRAQQLVTELQGRGFAPSINAPEGQAVKVVVGPFDGNEVTAAEAQLDASGYDHFRLR